MGTQAELDALKSRLAAKRNEYNECRAKCDDLAIASQSMIDLNIAYMNYDKEIFTKIDSYNQGSNKWVGVLFDEIEKTKEYFDYCYEKFDAINQSLQKLYIDTENYTEYTLRLQVDSLQGQVDRFKLDDEDDEKGGLFSWL